MNPPILRGTRVVVGGNLQPYAKALVSRCVYVPEEERWCIYLEWPDSPGGPAESHVWDTDENLTWYRYSEAN